MTVMRVDEAAVQHVSAAVDDLGETLWRTALSVAGSPPGPAVAALLSGYGIGAAQLTIDAERLAAALTQEAVRVRADTQTVTAWGNAVLNSQVAHSSAHDWVGWLERPVAFAGAAISIARHAHWLDRAATLTRQGQLLKAANRWLAFGHYDKALTNLFYNSYKIAGAILPGAAGRVAAGIGTVTDGVTSALTANAKPASVTRRFFEPIKIPPTAGSFTKVAAAIGEKAALPLQVASTAFDAYHLATDDYHELLDGDAQQHSLGQREAIYYGKTLNTVGEAILIATPVLGPAGVIVGGSLIGIGAAVRGYVWLQDTQKATGTNPVQSAPTGSWSSLQHTWSTSW